MKIRITALLSIILIVSAVLSACGGNGLTDKVIDLEAAGKALVECAEFDDSLREVPLNTLASVIGDIGAVKEASAYLAESGATAEAVMVMRCDSTEDAGTVKSLVEAYRDTQKHLFETYNPAEVPKLENAVIESRGLYVLYAVGKNTDAVKGVFGGLFN
ncbi:MAG: DUF4358 domain-containing protein [Clostridia bacterium]|nr:DUF4358 domain-containing protein [Clostridia bacterium]